MAEAGASALERLGGRHTLVPIRHLSPACARRLPELLDALEPERVLVEGPSDFEDLEALSHPSLRPPVALFAHVSTPPAEGSGARVRHVGWYPYASFSPELAALRWARARGVPARFADLPSYVRVLLGPDPAEPDPGALSRALREGHARDLEELWEALFETRREESAEAFFGRVAAYGRWQRALVPEEGHRLWRRREATLAAALRRAKGRAVLITGAVHLEGIARCWEEEAPKERAPAAPASQHRGLSLTAFSDARLVELAGPGAAPAFNRARLGGVEAWLDQLALAAREAREAELAVSTADLLAAAEMAERLARFRGRPGPTLPDVRDAVRTAWAKGALTDEPLDPVALVDAVFRGDRIGAPADIGDRVPLLVDVEAALRKARCPHEPDESRSIRLRPMRRRSDQERAQLLSQLCYLEIPYATQEAGPRYLEGSDLDRVEQRWSLEWTRETEEALIVAGSYGPTLREAVIQKLEEEAASGPPGAGPAAAVLRKACALGMSEQLEPLATRLAPRIDADPQLASVLSALHDLWLLYRYRDALGAVGLPALAGHLVRCFRRALALLHDLTTVTSEAEGEALAGLRALDHVARLGPPPISAETFLDAVERRLEDLVAAPAIHVAAHALLWTRGGRPIAGMLEAIRAHLLEAEHLPDAPGRAFEGLFAFTRRAYLDHPRLLGGVALPLRALRADRFLGALPGLRRAHSSLTPWEAAKVATEVKRRWGGGGEASAGPLAPSPALEALAAGVEAQMARFGFAAEAAAVEAEGRAEPERRPSDPELLLRFRLILGRFAEEALPLAELSQISPDGHISCQAGEGQEGEAQGGEGLGQAFAPGDLLEIDRVLGFLFDREYREAERGLRQGGGGASTLTVPRWIGELRRLFPRSVHEQVVEMALDRYGLTELVTDPEVLSELTPSVHLLDAVLRLKGSMGEPVLKVARRVVRAVVERLERKLRRIADQVFASHRGTLRYTPRGRAKDFAALRTIARNLKSYDPERRRLVVEQPWFATPHELRPWRVILCVDQSGSMLDSVVHASVLAAVLAKVRRLDPRLVTFDTSVVDLSEHLGDPLEALMSVQLGGGTDIAQALSYCAQLVTEPRRTLLVLITDLYEGGDPAKMRARAAALLEDGVRLCVLAALDDREGVPNYDREHARWLAARGAKVAALTPDALVRFIAEVIR